MSDDADDVDDDNHYADTMSLQRLLIDLLPKQCVTLCAPPCEIMCLNLTNFANQHFFREACQSVSIEVINEAKRNVFKALEDH